VGRVAGKVAFITGAARGQGRSHAVRLAQEGADIIAIDLCGEVESVKGFYPGTTPEDLAETVSQVEALDRRIVATQADVRDYGALKQALDDGVAQLGKVDVVVANAGIFTHGPSHELSEETWQDTIDINQTGVWHTCKAVIPHLISQNTGGSIMLISSLAGFKGVPNTIHYTSTKHALVGMMRTLANELAPYYVRVNTIHPNSIDTPMIQNERLYRLMRPDLENPTAEDASSVLSGMNAIPVPWMEPLDVSNLVLFLASDESRYVTGGTLPVDAGAAIK
jgi:SDR family mycofactocin-dependent oxidoreductase